jgi:DHA2 family multidrug resistance protein-like MFS transporter
MSSGATTSTTGEAMSISNYKAGRREWIALAALALPCIVYAMDLTVLNLAVPSLSTDLHRRAG